MMELPEKKTKHVEVIDPSISHYLRQEEVSKQTLEHWLGRINFKETDIFLIPYNERYVQFF